MLTLILKLASYFQSELWVSEKFPNTLPKYLLALVTGHLKKKETNITKKPRRCLVKIPGKDLLHIFSSGFSWEDAYKYLFAPDGAQKPEGINLSALVLVGEPLCLLEARSTE